MGRGGGGSSAHTISEKGTGILGLRFGSVVDDCASQQCCAPCRSRDRPDRIHCAAQHRLRPPRNPWLPPPPNKFSSRASPRMAGPFARATGQSGWRA
ncbi:hypothetical protein APY03_1846 [Variovorax sp. WDL1]|nr:hypothetical protein APY03_1846 [Variovorax sp. WDL1]